MDEPSTQPVNPQPNSNLSKQLKLEKGERRRQLAELINRVGIWNINKLAVSKQMGVSNVMIGKDIQWVVGHMKPKQLREITIQIDTANKKALNEAMMILATTQDDRLKLQAAETVSKLTKEYTEFCESYGIKAKIADIQKIEVSGQLDAIKLVSIVKEAEERRKGNFKKDSIDGK